MACQININVGQLLHKGHSLGETCCDLLTFDITFSFIPIAFIEHIHTIHRYYHSIITDNF